MTKKKKCNLTRNSHVCKVFAYTQLIDKYWSDIRPILGLSLLSDLFWIWFNILPSKISLSLSEVLLVLLTLFSVLQKNEYWLLSLAVYKKILKLKLDCQLVRSIWCYNQISASFNEWFSYCKRFLRMSLLRFWCHIMIITAMFQKSRLDCLLDHSLIMHTGMNCLTF